MDDLLLVPRGVFFVLSGLAGAVIMALLLAWRRARRAENAYGEYISDIARTCLGNGIGLSILEQIGRGDVEDAKGWWKEFRHGVECSKKDLGQLRQDVLLLRRAARGDGVQEVPADRNANEAIDSIRILQAEVRKLREDVEARDRAVAFLQGWIATIAKEAGGETERDPECGLPAPAHIDLRAAMTRMRDLWSRVNDLQSQLNAELAKPIEPKEYEESRKRLEARIEQATTSRDSALDRVAALEKDLEVTRNERDRLRADVARLEEMKEWPGVTTFLEQASIALESESVLDFPELLKLLVQVVARKNELDREVRQKSVPPKFSGMGGPLYPSELPRFLPVLLRHVIGILDGTVDRRAMFSIPAIQHQDLVLKLIEAAWTVSATKKSEPGDTRVILSLRARHDEFVSRVASLLLTGSEGDIRLSLAPMSDRETEVFERAKEMHDEFHKMLADPPGGPELNTGSDSPSGGYRAFYVDGAREAAGVDPWPVPPEPEFVKLAREIRAEKWILVMQGGMGARFGLDKAAQQLEKLLDSIEAAVKNAPAMVYARGPSSSVAEQAATIQKWMGIAEQAEGRMLRKPVGGRDPTYFCPDMLTAKDIGEAIKQAKVAAVMSGEPCHLVFNGSAVSVYHDDDTAFQRWQLGRKDYQTLLDSHVTAREAKLEARVRELEGKLKSAVEQVKMLEDLRDKMSGGVSEADSARARLCEALCYKPETPWSVLAEGVVLMCEGLVAKEKKPFAIEVGKVYLAQNALKWKIVFDEYHDKAAGERRFLGVSNEFPAQTTWFFSDGRTLKPGGSSLQSEVK